MNKKLTKTIRILLALLVMLTTGGVQRAWADNLSDINDAMTVTPTGCGTAEVKDYDNNIPGYCYYLYTELYVAPAPGYSTRLSKITATNSAGSKVFPQFSSDDDNDNVKTVDPADATGNYRSSRTIKIYWGDGIDEGCPTPLNIKITVEFEKEPLQLSSNLGEATVTFYEANVGFDPATPATFNPIDYAGDGTSEHPAKTPVTSVDNTDGIDRTFIVHVVPNPGYWTDPSLLFSYEAGAAAARTRASAPGIDLGRKLTLLKKDTYTYMDVSAEVPVERTADRHDGAGWYYYVLPGSHNGTANYAFSLVDGFAPKQFYLNGSNVWDPTNKVLTVTDGTMNGWSVEFTYDKVSYPFDGNTHRPTLDKLTVKYNGEKAIEFDGSTAEGRAAIDNQVVNGDGNDDCIIRDSHTINTNAAQPYPYCWFISGDYDAKFAITVPFSGSGTETDPWLIKGGADLTLLAKCVNIGYYSFANQYVVLDETYDYDVAADYAEFAPIGMKGEVYYTPFCGIFDGKDMTISGINYTYDPGLIVGDPSAVNSIGFFGQLGASSSEPVGVGIVKNVNLKNCTFTTDYDKTFYVGGIAGYIDRGGIYNSSVNGGTVSASNTSSHTGAIFGHKNSDYVALQDNHYSFDTNVTLGSGTSATTASGYTKRGGYVGTGWDDIITNEGAMLWVKKATVPAETASGSKVEFNEVTKGDNRYNMDGDDDYYYAVGQPVTLKVTTGTSTDGDIRTFYDQLTALTMNDGTSDTDIKDALGFTMPAADATVKATFTPSDWFTIPSNGKDWMSFYHEWKDGTGAAANYAVSDGSSSATTKTIDVKTITALNLLKAEVVTADLGGVSFSGVPTLFHCEGALPTLLRFDPVTGKTTPTNVLKEFKGVTTAKDMSGYQNLLYVMNGRGDFYYAEDKSDPLAAHRCYVDLGTTAIVAPARLQIADGEATGIQTPPLTPPLVGAAGWYDLQGRKLEGKPTKKGVYINNGKIIVIK